MNISIRERSAFSVLEKAAHPTPKMVDGKLVMPEVKDVVYAGLCRTCPSTATTTYIASRGSFFTAGKTSRLRPHLSLKQLTRPARLTQPSSRPSGATESKPGQCLISFGTN